VITKTALLVDDEEDLLEAFGFGLRHGGFRVLQAHNVSEAMALVVAQSPDVVVSDVRMPGGSGTELFTQIRAALVPAPPFVISTGFADLSLEDAYALGIQAVLIKPFEIFELLETARRVITPANERWAHSDRSLAGIAVELHLGPEQVALGCGGLFAAIEPLRTGERVRLRLDLPGGEVIGTGVVRWARSQGCPGCGIEFLSLADPKTVLERLVHLQARAFIPSGLD
jgi:CheY-like chemotaxis protein